MSTYHTVTWLEEGVWTAHSPSIPGAYGLGKTARAAETDLAEAVALLFEYLEEINEDLPSPSKVRLGELRI